MELAPDVPTKMLPKEDALSEEEVRRKYRHICTCRIPYEDTITKIIPQKGVFYADRWRFLHSLYFITSEGFYFQYHDICLNKQVHCDEEIAPYDMFLESALECAYSYAFYVEKCETLQFIRNIIDKGRISVSQYTRGPYVGKRSYIFTVPYYTWIVN